MRHRIVAAVTAVALVGLAAASPLFADTPLLPPTFRFSPKIVVTGATFTITGERFVGPSAVLLAVATTGAYAVLDVAPVVNGAFSRTVTAPSAPGPYFMVAQDGNGQLAVNLIGTLVAVPANAPLFGVYPTTVAPGDTLIVSASGFRADLTAAGIGLSGDTGPVAILGIAALTGGRFLRGFVVPPSLAAASYQPFVISPPQAAFNLTGPVTVWSGPRPPAVGVGFYPIGAAADEAANEIWVPNAGDNTVSILDGAANTEAGRVAVGALPCAIDREPTTGRIYVANVNTSDVTVIDTVARSAIVQVPAGRFPCAVGALPGRVFVGNYGSDDVTVIDAATNAAIATIAVGKGPFGIGTNRSTGRVYVANGYGNSVSVIDAASLAVVATVPVGRDPDAIGVNPSTNRVYVANYLSATVSIVDGATNTVLATVPVGREPSAVAVNPVTGHVFVANYESNTVSVIDDATGKVIRTIPVGDTPDGVAVNTATGRVYVVNSNTNDVTVIQDGSI